MNTAEQAGSGDRATYIYRIKPFNGSKTEVEKLRLISRTAKFVTFEAKNWNGQLYHNRRHAKGYFDSAEAALVDHLEQCRRRVESATSERDRCLNDLHNAGEALKELERTPTGGTGESR